MLDRFFRLALIVGTLPVTLANGTTADASQVMSDLNFIVNQINANAAQLSLTPQLASANTFTAAQIINGALTVNDQTGISVSANANALVIFPTNAAFSNTAISISATRAASNAFDFFNFKANGVSQLRVRGDGLIDSGSAKSLELASNGTIGITLSTATAVRFNAGYGAGTITSDASGNLTSVSGEEFKVKDGAPSSAVEMLMALKPGYYFWADKERFNKQRQLGFYAQNVNEALGEEAAPTPAERIEIHDGVEVKVTPPWGYYDRSVLAVNVMATQDHESRIAALEEKLASL